MVDHADLGIQSHSALSPLGERGHIRHLLTIPAVLGHLSRAVLDGDREHGHSWESGVVGSTRSEREE